MPANSIRAIRILSCHLVPLANAVQLSHSPLLLQISRVVVNLSRPVAPLVNHVALLDSLNPPTARLSVSHWGLLPALNQCQFVVCSLSVVSYPQARSNATFSSPTLVNHVFGSPLDLRASQPALGQRQVAVLSLKVSSQPQVWPHATTTYSSPTFVCLPDIWPIHPSFSQRHLKVCSLSVSSQPQACFSATTNSRSPTFVSLLDLRLTQIVHSQGPLLVSSLNVSSHPPWKSITTVGVPLALSATTFLS